MEDSDFQRALRVAQIAQEGYGNRLADGYPYLEAEVVYAVQEEMAVTAVDVLARRTRLAFLDTEAAALCMDRVISILDNSDRLEMVLEIYILMVYIVRDSIGDSVKVPQILQSPSSPLMYTFLHLFPLSREEISGGKCT